jgi:hypothetical protein
MEFGVYSELRCPRYISRMQTLTMGLIQGVDFRSFINKECFAKGGQYKQRQLNRLCKHAQRQEAAAASSGGRVSSHHHIERLAAEASAAEESPAAAVSNGTAPPVREGDLATSNKYVTSVRDAYPSEHRAAVHAVLSKIALNQHGTFA